MAIHNHSKNQRSTIQHKTSFSAFCALAVAPLVMATIGTSFGGLPSAHAQNTAAPPMMAGNASITPARAEQAANLIGEAFTLAERDSSRSSLTRLNAVRGAASLLPMLQEPERSKLTNRWQNLAMSGSISRTRRVDALSDFFDAATRRDGQFARRIAGTVTDHAARAGAFISLSQSAERSDWSRANEYAVQAQKAARREPNALYRARALTYVARRMASLNPALREAAVKEASTSVRKLNNGNERDFLLAEVAGASALFDLGTARRIANDINYPGLKNLAVARTNVSEISQTTLSSSTADRISALAQAAAKYDLRAVPVLLQLPPQNDVLRTLSDALPAIYPTATPAIEASLLERMWNYSLTADSGTYKDQLQSRLARLMVLHDLWRGRDWGKQLTWKGGRVQVGSFLQSVATARRSQLRLRAAPLQDLADRNISRAILEARSLAPAPRVEALLLIAGQILS